MTDTEHAAAARDFLDMAFNRGEPAEAAAKYVGATYTQHNPQLGDGTDAFVAFVTGWRGQFPEMNLEVKRAIAQDNMVVTHSHITLTPGSMGIALADFFRFEGSKVVEHWDVIQNIPETSANSNTMF